MKRLFLAMLILTAGCSDDGSVDKETAIPGIEESQVFLQVRYSITSNCPDAYLSNYYLGTQEVVIPSPVPMPWDTYRSTTMTTIDGVYLPISVKLTAMASGAAPAGHSKWTKITVHYQLDGEGYIFFGESLGGAGAFFDQDLQL